MNMQWPFFLFALFLAAKVNAQEPMDVPSLALPSNPCTCSDEAVSRYYEPISQLKEKLEAEKQRLREIQPALKRAEELGYPNMELLKTKTKKEIFDIMTIWKATEGK